MPLNKTFEEVALALKASFSEKFDAKLVIDRLTLEEEESAKTLAKKKYTTIQWNWKR